MAFKDFPFISDPTPVAIYKILNQHLGAGWWGWEPETLRMEIPGPLPEHRWSVIFATAAAVNQARDKDRTWLPWSDADIFGDIAVTFQGIQHIPDFWQKPQLDQIWYAVEVLKVFDDKAELEEDVKAYIAACLVYDNVFFYPYMDDFVKNKIIELSHRRELVEEIYKTWNNVEKRSELIRLPKLEPVCVQILKIEAANQLVTQRLNLGKRQIRFVA